MSRPPSSFDRNGPLLEALRGRIQAAEIERPDDDGTGATAVWAIDVGRASVLVANRSGAIRLGMRGAETAMPLDAAMPALRRLREMAARLAPGSEVRERLLLWTAAGAEHIPCLIAAVPEAAGVLIVRALDATGDGPAARSTSMPASPAVPATNDDEPPLPPPVRRDDAETLREIARRIREGQGRRAADSAVARPEARDSIESPAHAPSSAVVDTGKLAHELKTPLSAIIAASEIMRDQRLGPIGNERYRGYASDIHDSARHALAVINNMLGARGDEVTGRHPAPDVADQPQLFAQLDINALVEGTVSTMRPLAGNAGIALSARLPERLPNVIADPVSVRQILLNLLTNAIKFTPSGGAVTVATGYDLAGPVTIAVRDTGPGMSREDIDRALAPRWHGIDAASAGERAPRAGGGLGIGLPLVRQLSEANGATLAIESGPGGGTEVVVSFAPGRVVPV